MSSQYFTMELSIHRADTRCTIELSHRDSDDQATVAPVRVEARLEVSDLVDFLLDDEGYGRALSEMVFADPQLAERFVTVEAAAGAAGAWVRLVVRIDPSADDLHVVRWELLRHPRSGAVLATSERILLSRFMVSDDWRPVTLRPRSDLVALIAVSAPAAEELERRNLAPVDYAGELARASAALSGTTVRTLGGPGDPLSLQRLMDALRDGVDVLYLVCHGSFSRSGTAALVLQDDEGRLKIVRGDAIASGFAQLQTPPRLAVLASCQSGGDALRPERGTVQSTLAGRLADAGVAAVLAMQGFVTMATVEAMFPVFFRELLRDGQIDRALAAARGVVASRPDMWMPALYTRLQHGRIWVSEDGPRQSALRGLLDELWDVDQVRAEAERQGLSVSASGEVSAEFVDQLDTGDVDVELFERLVVGQPEETRERIAAVADLWGVGRRDIKRMRAGRRRMSPGIFAVLCMVSMVDCVGINDVVEDPLRESVLVPTLIAPLVPEHVVLFGLDGVNLVEQRGRWAERFRRLAEAGAEAAVLDLHFSTPMPEIDAEIARVAEETGLVVVLGAKKGPVDFVKAGSPVLRDGPIAFGHADAYTAPLSSLVRGTPIRFADATEDGDTLYALALEGFMRVEFGELGAVVEPGAMSVVVGQEKLTATDGLMRPWWVERPATIDVQEIDDGANLDFVRGKVVLFGTRKHGIDMHLLQGGGSQERYGVEFHAALLESLFQHRLSAYVHPVLSTLWALLLGALGFFFARHARPIRVAAASMAVAVPIGLLYFGILVPLVLPLLAYGLGGWLGRRPPGPLFSAVGALRRRRGR